MKNKIQIFTYIPNPRVWKASIAGRICEVEIDIRGTSTEKIKEWLWDFDARPIAQIPTEELSGLARTSRRGFSDSVLYKTNRFMNANPYGTVPAAFSSDGEIGVFESNSIMRLVARLGTDSRSLYGTNPYEASRTDSFLDASLGFGHDVQRYLLSLFSGKTEKSLHLNAQQATLTYLAGIERVLASGTKFLVGNGLTLADICFACEIALLTTEQKFSELLKLSRVEPILNREIWEMHPHCLEHFLQLVKHPSFAPDTSTYSEHYERMCE